MDGLIDRRHPSLDQALGASGGTAEEHEACVTAAALPLGFALEA